MRRTSLCLLGSILFAVLLSCALRSYLMVHYQVPPTSEQLAGRKVRVQVQESLTDTEILTPPAAELFGNFRNYYDMILVTPKKRIRIGVRDLQGLFQEAFERRLVNAGAQVVPAESTGAPLLQISISALQIDLHDRKWFTDIRYEASLFMDNQLIAGEVITGKAERPRVLGRDGIEENLSDLFTESINSLDIVKLFQKASLL